MPASTGKKARIRSISTGARPVEPLPEAEKRLSPADVVAQETLWLVVGSDNIVHTVVRVGRRR